MEHLVIDTREPFEYATGHVEGAINVPATAFIAGTLPAALAAVAKDQPMLVYCRSGQRSNTVKQILEKHGFTQVANGINQHHVAKMIDR